MSDTPAEPEVIPGSENPEPAVAAEPEPEVAEPEQPKVELPQARYYLLIMPPTREWYTLSALSLEELRAKITEIISNNRQDVETTEMLCFYGQQLKFSKPVACIALFQDFVIDGQSVTQPVQQYMEVTSFE